jgi:hypothetical protein
MQNFVMIEIVIVEIKIREISVHANKPVPAFASFESAGGEYSRA